MIRKIFPFIGEYKWHALLSPLTMLVEVLLEVMIPLQMARIVDIGIPAKDFPFVLKAGGLMLLEAIGALAAGILSARVSAVAANLHGTSRSGCSAACRRSPSGTSTNSRRPL